MIILIMMIMMCVMIMIMIMMCAMIISRLMFTDASQQEGLQPQLHTSGLPT